MPNYTYQCDVCKIRLVAFQLMSERDTPPPDLKCACEVPTLRRVPDAPATKRGDNWGKKGAW